MNDTKACRLNGRRNESGAGILKWVVVLGLVGLGGWAVFLLANQQSLHSEIEQLRAQAAQLQQEKQELETRQAQAPKPAEEASNLEVVKLRGEITRLRTMEKQYQQLLAENQQLRANNQQLQQANAETANLKNANAQLQGTLQAKAFTEQCVANLKQVMAAKALWAADNQKKPYDVPLDVDIFGKYLPQKPVCPAGGVYNLAPVQAKPTCTIAGHTY